MKPFQKLDGLVAPMDRANVDTDAIIPKQFLKSIKRSGFGLAGKGGVVTEGENLVFGGVRVTP